MALFAALVLLFVARFWLQLWSERRAKRAFSVVRYSTLPRFEAEVEEKSQKVDVGLGKL
jgi:hypothetical protein